MSIRYIKKSAISIFIVVFTALFFKTVSQAQDGETENKNMALDSHVRYMPACEIDVSAGKIEIMESEAEYSYEFKVFDRLPVKFSLGTQYIGIEDTVDLELPSHLTGFTTDLESTLPFFTFKNIYLRLGLSPSFYGDDWDFEPGQLRIPSRYFLIHRPNARWTLIAGVAVYPDFESEVLPILGFVYQPNDRLKFNIIPERPNISYLMNEKITLFLEGGSSFNREFEVKRNNLDGTVLKYREARLGGGLKFKLNKFIQSSISIGSVFNRRLKYRDNQGKVNIKDGLYTEFRIEAGF